jgi:hypothetical protein
MKKEWLGGRLTICSMRRSCSRSGSARKHTTTANEITNSHECFIGVRARNCCRYLRGAPITSGHSPGVGYVAASNIKAEE